MSRYDAVQLLVAFSAGKPQMFNHLQFHQTSGMVAKFVLQTTNHGPLTNLV